MNDVTIYSSAFCPYCYMAKKLLQKKGVEYVEIDVAMHPRRREEMMERAGGRRTVPQVFIGDTHVGGNDDLQALDRDGRLDQLLEAVR